MKKVVVFVWNIFLLSLFVSCSQPKRQDFIGKWKSEDNSILYLYSDSTFKMQNVPCSILFDYDTKELYSGTGKWEFRPDDKYYDNEIELTINLNFPFKHKSANQINFEKVLGLGELRLFLWGENFDSKYIYYKEQK